MSENTCEGCGRRFVSLVRPGNQKHWCGECCIKNVEEAQSSERDRQLIGSLDEEHRELLEEQIELIKQQNLLLKMAIEKNNQILALLDERMQQ